MTPPKSQEETLKLMGGVKRFAWIPTKVNSQWIFLKEYYEFYRGEVDDKGRAFLWSGARDTWQPITDRLLPEDALVRKIKRKYG